MALDYAVHHPSRLSGLILIDTWTVGTLGAMGALANILTSDRVQVDKARQLRVWSGNLLSDQDYQDGITELLPFYEPPGDVAKKTSSTTVAESSPTSAELFGPGRPFHVHYETQNWAFSHNMPRFDVRQQLKDIKAGLSSPSLDVMTTV
jgi:proline iminopeptidase